MHAQEFLSAELSHAERQLARVRRVTCSECGAFERVQRLDRTNGQKPVNPLDSRSLTLKLSARTDWPVFLS